MMLTPDDLPSDLASALAALRAEREARLRVEAERDVAQTEASNWQAEAAKAQAMLSDTEARIAHLELDRLRQIVGAAQRSTVDQDVKITAVLVRLRDPAIDTVAEADVEQPNQKLICDCRSPV